MNIFISIVFLVLLFFVIRWFVFSLKKEDKYLKDDNAYGMGICDDCRDTFSDGKEIDELFESLRGGTYVPEVKKVVKKAIKKVTKVAPKKVFKKAK